VVDTRALIEYQEADVQTGRHKRRLQEIKAQLTETEELKASRRELQALQQRLHEVQSHQKSTEWDVETTRARMRDLDARMMAGQGISPRDLQSIQRELGNLRQRQQTLEDGVLVLMEEAEGARAAHDRHAQAVAALEVKWREAQAGLLTERRRIEEEMPLLDRRRKESAAALDEATRQLYERMKLQKGGRAMAKVEGGICAACRITVPATVVLRARAGKELAYCNSCGRILYVA